MFAPGAYLVWVALGAALTGAADAAFGLSLEGQLGVFAAATALSCAAGYFVYRDLHRRQRHEEPLNERHRSMLGERGTVCEGFVNGRGKVRLGDSVWLAAGPDLAEGAPVVVNGFRGTRLVVDALQPKPPTEPAAGP
jgi:membrane protein implicated in regulation of membrane protease activity